MHLNGKRIAEVKLRLITKDDMRSDITIEICQPTQSKDGLWHTPIALHGDYGWKNIFGEDSFQSLSLAIKFIRILLTSYLERGDRLVFQSDNSDFPIESYFDTSA
jgi:hypothetical protein